MSRVDEILMMAKAVPPFPKVAHRVLAMLDDPSVKAADLAEVIQYDAAITANILKICNSALFGLHRKITSLDEALVVLGQDELKDVIITSSSAKFYKGKVGAGYDLGQGDLWKHSVASAVVARQLAPKIAGTNPSAAFTTALLHDIGKRFMSSFVADELKRIVVMVDVKKLTFVEAEKKVLGMTHAELGAMILERWEFPEEMAAAVRSHHDADALGKGPLAATVAMANAIVVSLGIGGGADGLATRLQGEGVKKFGIDTATIESCMADLLFELEKAQEVLNL